MHHARLALFALHVLVAAVLEGGAEGQHGDTAADADTDTNTDTEAVTVTETDEKIEGIPIVLSRPQLSLCFAGTWNHHPHLRQ